MAQHIGEQVSLTRAWYPVAGVLLILGFVPGMPNLLFLIAAIVAGGVAYLVNRNLQFHSQNDLVDGEQGEMRLEGDGAKPEQIELSEIADNSPISIQLGYGLVDMVNEENGGLVNRVTGIRRQVSKSLGFVVPAVRIRDDLTLEANTYRLRIGQTIVVRIMFIQIESLLYLGKCIYQDRGYRGKRPNFWYGCCLDYGEGCS